MAKKRAARKRRRKAWIPSGEDLGASHVGAAVRALERHGGRPEIRRVPEHVETIDMTHSMFERLQREDFPTLNETIKSHVPLDPAKGVHDTRGIALQLLVAALEFKERLKAYRTGATDIDLDSLLWSLSHAEAVYGELRTADSFEFDRNRLQWMRGPGQARGREAKARATKVRNDGIRAMAEEFRADRKNKGRPAPSLAQTARHVRRKLEDTAEPSRGRLSEKSLRDIISGRR